MEFKCLTVENAEWLATIEYAKNCSWSAGKFLANDMADNIFTDWERVVVAIEQGKIAGYCTVTKSDCIPNLSYTPYIGFLFVGEEYRGKRLSQKIIEFSMAYLKQVGFTEVYLVSDHVNLYEKYGFEVIDRQIAPWGEEEKIYMQKL